MDQQLPARWSPDGRYFWDGVAWRTASPDRRHYYDGAAWRVVPAGRPPDLRVAAWAGAGLGALILLAAFIGLPSSAGKPVAERWGAIGGSLVAISVGLMFAIPAAFTFRKAWRFGAPAAVVVTLLFLGTCGSGIALVGANPQPSASPTAGGDVAQVAGPTTSPRPQATPSLAQSPPTSPSPASPVAAPSATGATATATGDTCSNDPFQHVYNSYRLQVLSFCVTVTGIVQAVRTEADGDVHVRLRVDPGQLCGDQNCINASNTSAEGGDLVLEPVCEKKVTQADAVSACSGFQNPVAVPAVGAHISATGPFVRDKDHGWLEIHPLEAYHAVSGAAPPSTPTAAPSSSSPPGGPPTAAPASMFVTITSASYGYLAAKTLPGASCSAKATLPSGNVSSAAGLQATPTAGSDGMVSWTYGTTSRTGKGQGRYDVSCTLNGQTATASAPFTV